MLSSAKTKSSIRIFTFVFRIIWYQNYTTLVSLHLQHIVSVLACPFQYWRVRQKSQTASLKTRVCHMKIAPVVSCVMPILLKQQVCLYNSLFDVHDWIQLLVHCDVIRVSYLYFTTLTVVHLFSIGKYWCAVCVQLCAVCVQLCAIVCCLCVVYVQLYTVCM